MHVARLLRFCALAAPVLLACCSSGCGSERGDPPSAPVIPLAAGKGQRIHEIADPASPLKAAHKTQVSVSGAVVVAVDDFDETKNGRSANAIYVADLGSQERYSGLSLFNPSFIPGNLRIGPGDTLDLRGEYQENNDIPLQFAPDAFLVQLASPIGTFRFDAKVTEPVDIDIKDLAEYKKGRAWLNMLVRVKNVTLQGDASTPDKNGRSSSKLLGGITEEFGCDAPFPKAPTVVNELMDLAPLELSKDTVLKELVGVVTFFCNLHIAPRTPADIVR